MLRTILREREKVGAIDIYVSCLCNHSNPIVLVFPGEATPEPEGSQGGEEDGEEPGMRIIQLPSKSGMTLCYF